MIINSMNISRIIYFILAAAFFTACTSTPLQTSSFAIPQNNTKKVKASSKPKTQKPAPKASVSPKKKKSVKKRYVSSRDHIKLRYDKKHYDHWHKHLSKKARKHFQRHLKNGDRFRKVIESILKSYNLPLDLYYVGLIESGYNTHAISSASAVGPWQFMKKTGRHYGMRVDRFVDERRNIIKSTHSAAKYLKDLYNILGSWELALCAYNAGEYRVINAIRKGNTRNYRSLVRKKLIPQETIYYIPKLAAARDIEQNREKYGFTYDRPDKDFNHTEYLTLGRHFRWDDVISQSNVSPQLMKKLNPDFKRNTIISKKNFKLIVPKRMSSLKLAKRKTRPTKNLSYRVQRGDTLTKVADIYGVPVAEIIRKNKLRNGHIQVGQRLMIPRHLIKIFKPKKQRIHRVRRGDSLIKLAKTYKVRLQDIIKLNALTSNNIYINQRIKIPHKKTDKKIYVVKKGDSLARIAKRFNSSIKTIVAYNRLKTRTIYPKQKLYIPPVKYL